MTVGELRNKLGMIPHSYQVTINNKGELIFRKRDLSAEDETRWEVGELFGKIPMERE